MKISRISKKLQQDYKKKRINAYIGMTIPAAFAFTIIAMAVFGRLKGTAFILVYVAIGLLLVALNYFTRLMRLSRYASTLSDTTCKMDIDISENGILADFKSEGDYLEKLFTWDELINMNGFYVDLNSNRTSGKSAQSKYKMASITNSTRRELSDITREIKEQKYNKDKQTSTSFNPSDVIVELYDEMLAEIRMYWKKEEQE